MRVPAALLAALLAAFLAEAGPTPPSDPTADLSLSRLAGAAPGATLLVVAGLHGDEPTGPAAARHVAAGAPPARGTLLVLAEACPEALEAGARAAPGQRDLNRVFPGDAQGDAAARRAAEIFRLVRRERPDLILDLHESDRSWTEGEGPALVLPSLPAAAALALALLEHAELAGFSFTGSPPAGSLAAEAARLLGIPVLIVEVPDRLPPAERVQLLLRAVAAARGVLGMGP